MNSPIALSLIRKNKNESAAKTRERCGKISGIVSIVLNTLLAAGKIAVGAIFGAISVTADGLNNLTDCGSNAVSFIGFRMSGKPADKEHPFGHRRAESVSALAIAMLVLVVAAELLIQSVEKLFSAEKSDFSLLIVIVLAVSAAVKLWMFLFNRTLGKKLSSDALKATAADSLSDAVATLAVLACQIISHETGAELDGYAGIAVALFIAFTGFSIFKNTVSKLIGKAPDKETVQEIRARILSFEGVVGLHDLTVHDYGQDKRYATAHVEVDAHMPIMAAHDLADEIERDFKERTGIFMTVHIDPLVLDDPKVNRYRQEAERIVRAIDPSFSVHDFRLVGGETHSNLVFDVAIPFDSPLSEAEITERIRDGVTLLGENLDTVVTVERQNSD